uniref:iron-containing alcohol dehydrogenase n=1 Tax=Rhizobium laguerreae TaxID=1076926 RepID=UPI0036F3D633
AEALYAELSDVIQPGYRRQSNAADAVAFIAEIEAICRDCGVPDSLSAVGIGEGDLSKLAKDAMKQKERLLVKQSARARRRSGRGDLCQRTCGSEQPMTPSSDDQPESPHSTYDIVVTFVGFPTPIPLRPIQYFRPRS